MHGAWAWQEHGTCAGCQSNQYPQFDCPTSPVCSRCGCPHPRQRCTARAGEGRPVKPNRQAKPKAEEDLEAKRQQKRASALQEYNKARKGSLELDRQAA
jgi:hypothetical protein